MKKALIAALLVVGLVAVRPAAYGDDTDVKNPVDFLVKASADGTAEVKLGQLAEKQAASDKVKDFARMMVEDHRKANDKLADFARGLKTAVLAGLEKDKQAIYDKLSKLKGEEFDRAYMDQMVEDHEKAVKMFETASKGVTHEGLKKFAEDTLPHLRDHLKHARSVREGLGK